MQRKLPSHENRRTCSLRRRRLKQLQAVGYAEIWVILYTFEPIVKSQAGIYRMSQKLGLDHAYEEKLDKLIQDSSLDAILLLAIRIILRPDEILRKSRGKILCSKRPCFKFGPKIS